MNAGTRTLPSFDAARPLGFDDADFVNELHDLLEKHENLDRFGLCLLHEHFPVARDEILLETNDLGRRTLSLDVVKRTDLTSGKFTSWRIGGPNAEPLAAGAHDQCKIEALTKCDKDKCKVEALTKCDEDKCK